MTADQADEILNSQVEEMQRLTEEQKVVNGRIEDARNKMTRDAKEVRATDDF